jgi:formate--tetrahydrofolate ligase
MPSDLEIANSAETIPIEEVAWKLGIGVEELIPTGDGIAKIRWTALESRFKKPQGFMVLITSVHPTPFGEGKTVTTIGLTQALNRFGRQAVCTIREPSMGPVFGIKGGAAGGGYSQVVPMEDINLHFTGDLHAVTSAHNLLSNMLDNHLKHGNELDLDPTRIIWPRVIDLNDRSLRQLAIGLGGAKNGMAREERFDITAASEVMAILTLSKDYADLRHRLGQIVVGQRRDGYPVKAEDIGAAGAMALLLRTAFLPNLVQTLENNPAFVHGGPFANIAHGNSSIIADRLALATSEFVITEAGFGSDMGAEKFMHIKAPLLGRGPDCIVVNVTVRAMKLHGGAFGERGNYRPTPEEIAAKNVPAVRKGARSNLDRHIRNMLMFGMPVIVSINLFASDTESEIATIEECARESGARSVVRCNVFSEGGAGGRDLAKSVVAACEEHLADGRPFKPLFKNRMPATEKALRIATNLYRAAGLNIRDKANRQWQEIEKWGYANLPICMAKTQYSFSHDADLLGAPEGFDLPIREFRLNAGAGYIVAVLGEMMTMPGLPKKPAAIDMDIDERGHLKGVFS